MPELNPSPDAPAGFPYLEKTARQKIGLPKDDMRALRRAHLKEGDFVIHKKALYLSQGAVDTLLAAAEQLSVKSRPAQSSSNSGPVKIAPPKKAPAPERLLIVNATLSNKRMLHCCAADEDPDRPKKLLRVRVRSQEGFRIRTAIEAQLVEGYDDLYDLVSKYPRKKQNL
jgi:hypothetical protein